MHCHRWQNLGSPLSTRNQAEEHAAEASVNSCCKEIQDATIGRQVDVDHLGSSKAYSQALRGTWNNRHKCKLLWHASERVQACMLETLTKLKWEVMEYPAHSPNLVPSDFYLFWLLKEAVGGRFQSDDVKNAIDQWLHVQSETFYYDGIKELI
jgi:hypothetical protein